MALFSSFHESSICQNLFHSINSFSFRRKKSSIDLIASKIAFGRTVDMVLCLYGILVLTISNIRGKYCGKISYKLLKIGNHPHLFLFLPLKVQGLGNTRILLTCHGFDSQCLEEPEKLALCGLDPGRLHRPDRLQDTAKTHLVNILKGGIVYSNKVVVMSSMHSKGRIIRSMSHGLEPTLALHKEKILVAPCGFDNSIWDPAMDKFLPVNYSSENMRGKDACKVALQQQAGLAELASSILVGCIISEVSDYDLEKLKAVVWNATKGGAQFVFMGNVAGPTIDSTLRSFQEELKDLNVKFFYCYDEALLHLMFAGSDIILCQSFHDPLLQVPLKALKYGAAPVSETFSDKNLSLDRYSTDHDHDITRFSQFMRSTFGNMSLSQALDEIKTNPSTWKRKITNAMTKDFSWDAECYDIHVSAYTAVKSL